MKVLMEILRWTSVILVSVGGLVTIIALNVFRRKRDIYRRTATFYF